MVSGGPLLRLLTLYELYTECRKPDLEIARSQPLWAIPFRDPML